MPPQDANPPPSFGGFGLKGQAERRALETDEVDQLLKVAGGTRYDVPIRFTLATGLRLGEFLVLSWDNLDLDARVLNCGGTKSVKSRRSLELSGATVALVRSHFQEQLQRRMKVDPVWQEHDLVFPPSVGTPWFRRTFYRDYKSIVAKTNIADTDAVTWHTLRHTAASSGFGVALTFSRCPGDWDMRLRPSPC